MRNSAAMFTPEEITPRMRLRQSHLSGVRKIEQAQVPAYGLPPAWGGFRATGNTCFSTGLTRDASGVHAEIHESIELVHTSGQSFLRVESSDQPQPIGDEELVALVGGTGACDSMTVAVDGRDIEFARALSGDEFVARWVGYEATVTVLGRRWPTTTGLELVRITDFTAYHEGRLRLLEQRSALDLH